MTASAKVIGYEIRDASGARDPLLHPTELARALTETAVFLRRYVVFPSSEQADAAALWVGHTYLYDQFDTTPYLAIQSPEKRSGKTRLLECFRLLVRQAQPMAGASLAALFRIINERHPTLLLDEADTIFGKRKADNTEDVRGLLNNGYRRGTPFLRVVGEGKKMHVESFDVFCPKAIASIGRLPDTVQDRSIVLALKRRAAHEEVQHFRFRKAEQEAIPLRECWQAIAAELRLPEEADVPDQLDDRAADSWEPLLALADAAAEEWPARARRAALVLSGAGELEDDSLSVQLLADVRAIFDEKGVDRLATNDLLDALRARDESPWAEYRDRGLTAYGLSKLLRPYAIGPRQMRVAGDNVRGYQREHFADAFNRYLPPPENTPPTRYSATAEHESERERSGVADQAAVTGDTHNGPNRPPTGLWTALADAAADGPGEVDASDPPVQSLAVTPWCRDFRAHQSSHTLIASGVWWCAECRIEVEVPV